MWPFRSNGDLALEGRDYGPGVEKILGYPEYEWAWTIESRSVWVSSLPDPVLSSSSRFLE